MYKDNKENNKTLNPYDCLESNPKYKLAHAYVPYQVMDKIYSLEEALKRGTLFPELHLPYYIREDNNNC